MRLGRGTTILAGVFLAALLGGVLLAAQAPDPVPDPNQAELQALVDGNSGHVSSAGNLASPTTAQFTEQTTPLLPRHVSLGINDLGAQLRLHFTPDWAAEARFLTGSASSDVGTVNSHVYGARGYHFFPERRRFKLYAGIEADYVTTSIKSVNSTNDLNNTSVVDVSGFGQTSGYATGGFGGVEYRVTNRIAIDLDIGPYMIGLKEKVTGVSDASLYFVGNTAINVYLF